MSSEKMRLGRCCDDIPLALQSIYNGRSKGRIDWLTREGPTGRKTRDLWVDVPRCREWAKAQGLTLGPTLRGVAG